MKYVLKPSLEHMALVKICIALWDQNDVRALIGKNSFSVWKPEVSLPLYSSFKIEKWIKIEEYVIEKVSHLPLPVYLKENVSAIIRPIGFEIVKWMEFNCTGSYLLLDLPAKLCWTPQGTIDKMTTVVMLIKDESLDIVKRYKLACIYCLKDVIPKLYNEISEDCRESILNEDSYQRKCNWYEDYHRDMVSLWTNDINPEGRIYPVPTYYHLLKVSAFVGNNLAIKYLLPKQIAANKQRYFERIAKITRNADVLLFLLSHEEQQTQILKSCPALILLCFIQWPLQSFFIDIANCMWEFLSEVQYYSILKAIILKQNNGFQDCDYKNLFCEFWQRSGIAFKSFVINKSDDGCLIYLFRIKDKGNSRLMLMDTSAIEKKETVYCDSVQSICQSLLNDCEWDSLEFFIQECLLSRDEMLKFKEEFENRVETCYLRDNLEKDKEKWNRLFHLSSDSVCMRVKRSIEEGENSSSKRLNSQK